MTCIYLREVDAGTPNACWVVSNKVDARARPFYDLDDLRGMDLVGSPTDTLLVECSAMLKLLCMGEQRKALLTDEQLALLDATLGKIEDARIASPWLAPKRLFRWFGRRDGIRFAVKWLAARAIEMNDPHAKTVLDSAATNLGWEGARLHKKDPHKDHLGGVVTDEMAKASYEARITRINIPKLQMRTLKWEELPEFQKEAERGYLLAAIGAGI